MGALNPLLIKIYMYMCVHTGTTIQQLYKMSRFKQIHGYKINMSHMLGSGSYGDVFTGISQQTNIEVAVKIIQKAKINIDEYLKQALFSEIKILRIVKSENIVNFIQVMESSRNYYIVQQLCDGDLSSIVKLGSILPEEQAKGYLLQICNGFLALVREGIVHRDLKPANIMIKGDQIKIGDFGFAKKTADSQMKNQTNVGTLLYMSPQILKSEPYTSKCDIWALGVIYYQMLHGTTPWKGTCEFNLIKKMQQQPLKIDSKISNLSQHFLEKCLALNEQDRISWDELFLHPIFNEHFKKYSEGNLEFENKLKMVMADLRLQINAQNLDLFRILTALGYKLGSDQIDQEKFYRFLKIVSPNVTHKVSDYIFSKTDLDHNGYISIHEIELMMKAHCIQLTSYTTHIPGIVQKQSSENKQKNTGFVLTKKSQKKVLQCFFKLFKVLQQQKRILYNVFMDFDKIMDGRLQRREFAKLLRELSQTIEEDEIDAAFDLIDKNRSNSIEFKQLNEYFSKINGIPQHVNGPSSPDLDALKPSNFFEALLMQDFSDLNEPQPYQQAGYIYEGYYQYPPPPQNYHYQPQMMNNTYQYNPYLQQTGHQLSYDLKWSH